MELKFVNNTEELYSLCYTSALLRNNGSLEVSPYNGEIFVDDGSHYPSTPNRMCGKFYNNRTKKEEVKGLDFTPNAKHIIVFGEEFGEEFKAAKLSLHKLNIMLNTNQELTTCYLQQGSKIVERQMIVPTGSNHRIQMLKHSFIDKNESADVTSALLNYFLGYNSGGAEKNGDYWLSSFRGEAIKDKYYGTAFERDKIYIFRFENLEKKFKEIVSLAKKEINKKEFAEKYGEEVSNFNDTSLTDSIFGNKRG